MTEATNSTQNDIEVAKLRLEERRLEVEEARLAHDKRFLTRNSGVLITASVSLAALIVSAANVEVARINQTTATEAGQSQHENERELKRLEHERQWRLDAATLLLENHDLLFSENGQVRSLLGDVMKATFPYDVYRAAFRPIAEIEMRAGPKPKNCLGEDLGIQLQVLIQEGEGWVRDGNSDYSDITNWEDRAQRLLEQVDARYVYSTFSFMPGYHRTQERGRNIADAPGLYLEILSENVDHLTRALENDPCR